MINMMGEMYDQGSGDVMVKWCAHYNGSTCLHEAAFKGSFSVVRALCNASADPTLTNARGYTPGDTAEELQLHIDRQAREKEEVTKQALLLAQPCAKPELPAAPAAPLRTAAAAASVSAWSFWPSSWASAV